MSWIDKIIDAIVRLIVRTPDKDKLTVKTLAQAQAKKKAAGQAMPEASMVAGQQWVPDKEDNDADNAWTRERYGAADKQLTAYEVNELLLQGLDLGKAALIKSLMNGKDTQEMVSAKLQKEHGRGFSVSTISPYWKILSPSPTAENRGEEALAAKNFQ